MKFSLRDIVILSGTAGAVYYLLRRNNALPEPVANPLPEVRKVLKQVRAGRKPKRKSAGVAKRGGIVTDRSPGRRVAVENADGSTAHHVVGRGVRTS